ncbi:sugar ABC transporter ATP-binding protein [Autumnicola musiva]|uniref:Sugar ABC transporter ATP-binding protein n=1 Tax=Autumnicola musiva TaxID=3075589 RepID=A0ABU3D802_9FLAO|nr:ATP-binding cassette domain-containing protein [Zunongwangia sp. F117]MDT0677634.1 sugar ABC transporter ATP-binding protein [Zunongwangia sp. F117]
MESSTVILQANGITKKFAGVTALQNINLDVHRAKVNVVVGENGAGKSTLMKILSGVYPDYEGQLLLEGKPVSFQNPKEAMEKGIAIIHQELNLIPYLSITANIFLGRELKNSLGMLDFKKMNQQASDLLKRLQCNLSPKTRVGKLRVGEQQLVEIAKALLEDAQVLIMDEPTSAITDTEVEVLFRIISSLKKEGVAILYISHKLDELFKIADRYIGLRDGEMVGTIEEVQEVNKPDLIRLMVGRNIENTYRKNSSASSEEILKVKNISLPKDISKSRYLVQGVNFVLHKGEILGIFGLMGAGRTELLEALFGLHPKIIMGEVFMNGEKVKIKSVKKAIEFGLAMVPEDRKKDGLVMNMDIARNVSMACIDKNSNYGLLDFKKERNQAKNYIKDLRIKATSEKQKSKNLSGGNQQKVVLSKWLATKPKVIFLDEPTRGIDVNAKNEIYHLINELAAEGMGIIVVSSELPEIMAISDRILVMSNSKLTGEFQKETATEDNIMKAATA